jgi:hypothetical protein
MLIPEGLPATLDGKEGGRKHPNSGVGEANPVFSIINLAIRQSALYNATARKVKKVEPFPWNLRMDSALPFLLRLPCAGILHNKSTD